MRANNGLVFPRDVQVGRRANAEREGNFWLQLGRRPLRIRSAWTIEWKDRSQSDEVEITGSKFKEKVFIRKQVGLADGAEWKKGRKHCEWRRSDACVPFPPTYPLLVVCFGRNLNPSRTKNRRIERRKEKRKSVGVVFNRGNTRCGTRTCCTTIRRLRAAFVCSSGCESGGAASDVALLERCRGKHSASLKTRRKRNKEADACPRIFQNRQCPDGRIETEDVEPSKDPARSFVARANKAKAIVHGYQLCSRRFRYRRYLSPPLPARFTFNLLSDTRPREIFPCDQRGKLPPISYVHRTLRQREKQCFTLSSALFHLTVSLHGWTKLGSHRPNVQSILRTRVSKRKRDLFEIVV